MGTCLSKKPSSSSSSSPSGAPSATETATTATEKLPYPAPAPALVETDPNKNKPKKKEEEDESLVVKKEIFVIKHRKSQDRDHRQQKAADTTSTHSSSSACEAVAPTVVAAGVRTSSCTKEEVDAILIQCGRLSRSSSGNLPSSASCDSNHRSTTAGTGTPKKYSGSKRSYDFDHDAIATATAADDDKKKRGNDNDYSCDRKSRPISSSSDHGGRRRRTPSREREERQQQQRSGSRERRVSRSPGRRSETTTPAPPIGTGTARPGKMVSVPPTVSSSLVMDKSNNLEPAATTTSAVKRISVKRNAGAASPRSQSPARTNAKVSNNENQQQPSFSRSSSRKAEQSPCRRNPLSEIDNNSLANPQLPSSNNNCSNKLHNTKGKEVVGDGTAIKDSSNILNQQAPMHKPNVEINSNRVVVQGTNQKTSSRGTLENKVVAVNCIAKEEQAQMTTTVVASGGAESLKPQKLTRSRSSRRSYDLDLNTETLLNPNTSYTTLLLEDIQNFHQKNTTTAFSLPSCVTKACSILDAVADLNSTTSSNPSCAFSEGRKGPPMDQSKMNKKRSEVKDPFVESEVAVSDDLMEPSFHKYVTVRRGGALGEADLEDQESSGSNSFVGGSGGQQQHWGISSSSWEPNSADSKDCWTSRSNNTREEEQGQRCFPSESACNVDEARRGCSGRKRESDQQTGIGRFRIGDGRALHSIATAAST